MPSIFKHAATQAYQQALDQRALDENSAKMAKVQAANDAPTPSQQLAVVSILPEVHTHVEALSEALARHEDRLMPLLRPTNPSPTTGESPPLPESDVVNDLVRLRERLASFASHVRSLTERLS